MCYLFVSARMLNGLGFGHSTDCSIQCVLPVSLGVVQGAAGPEGFVVILSPADQGHGGPEGAEQPDEHAQSDGTAPLQLGPWGTQWKNTFLWESYINNTLIR